MVARFDPGSVVQTTLGGKSKSPRGLAPGPAASAWGFGKAKGWGATQGPRARRQTRLEPSLPPHQKPQLTAGRHGTWYRPGGLAETWPGSTRLSVSDTDTTPASG